MKQCAEVIFRETNAPKGDATRCKVREVREVKQCVGGEEMHWKVENRRGRRKKVRARITDKVKQ